jgi:hypothetical protein
MKILKLRKSVLRVLVLDACVAGCTLLPGGVQAASHTPLSVTVTAADQKAAEGASATPIRLLAVKGPNGVAAQTTRFPGAVQNRSAGDAASSDPSFVQSGVRYTGDVTYLGGAVIAGAQQHVIYLLPNGSCPIATCWGDPEGFLADLSKSRFVHLADQYVGASGPDRYPVGQSSSLSFAAPRNFSSGSTPLTDADMQAAVHAVAKASGQTGYGHIYHVLLPQGADVCTDTTYSNCYAPDSGAQWLFCGYHGSVDFTDIGHVVYAVEPYQDVSTPTVFTAKPGTCAVQPNTPNGTLVDSTDNLLSRLTFGTITDPDGSGWVNATDLVFFNTEISDECTFADAVLQNPATGNFEDVFFFVDVFRVASHRYGLLPIYDNAHHACTIGPSAE